MKEPRKPLNCTIATIAGIFCNILIKELTHVNPSMPLFMDSIGTVAVAFYAGLLPGMIAGLLTNFSYLAIFTFTQRASDSQPVFALCGMATALIVVLFARPHERKISMFDLIVIAIVVSAVNSVLGGLISTIFYGGIEQYPSDFIVVGMLIQKVPILAATILSRIPINVLDKTIAVLLGYALALLAKKYFDPYATKNQATKKK